MFGGRLLKVSERCDGADPGVRMGIGLCLDLNLRLSLSGLSGASR